ncbi:MAG: Lrp/AsnC family transcriptional regulator [Novosphingobium sp.]|nr:Lrp/AsnC family transcriptional regulator [Novosphingobium sp.]
MARGRSNRKTPGPAPGFDDVDRTIIAALRADGRASNQQLAEQLGLTATTVSTRIRRMEAANQLRVVAVSDFSAHGYNVLMRISISVIGRAASDVVDDLSDLPEVVAAHIVTGSYDIDVLVALHGFADLADFLMDRLSGVRGIRTLTPAIVVDIIKYTFDVAPIEAKA